MLLFKLRSMLILFYKEKLCPQDWKEGTNHFFLIKKKMNEWMSDRRTIHDTKSPIRIFFYRFYAFILLFI